MGMLVIVWSVEANSLFPIVIFLGQYVSDKALSMIWQTSACLTCPGYFKSFTYVRTGLRVGHVWVG